MEGPVDGQIYATIVSLKPDLEPMMSSPSPGNLDNNISHRSGHQPPHRYQAPHSPTNGPAKRNNVTHIDRRRAEPDQRIYSDNRNQSQSQQPLHQHHPHQQTSRKFVENDSNYYSSSQESSSSKKVAPMWSPSSDVTANQKYESLAQHHTCGTHRLTAQSEIEKLDDLLQELTPRLNDSPSEYLRRRRQSFSNSSKSTTFEGRARQDTFIQGFSPTSPHEGKANDKMSCNNVEQCQTSSASVVNTSVVHRYGSHGHLEGTQTKPRYSNWHTEEKKKLQRARSLLDEKDRFLTEQLRRYQTRPGARDNSTMSPSGYRPGSSHQMIGESWPDRYSSYANKDYVPASEWEDVRMFSDHYGAGQTRRATSEMDYPLRDMPIDRRNQSPVVGSVSHRRRPLIRHYSADKDEVNYPRSARLNHDHVTSYRAYSPSVNRYQNGSPAHQEPQVDYGDDIPQVTRRNIRNSVLSSRLLANHTYQGDSPTITKLTERNPECLPLSSINRGLGPLSPTQTQMNMDSMNNTFLKDLDKGTATPELLKKSRNSGFQIRADHSARASGICYYDPDDAYLSSDGYPLVSKLHVAQSPTEKPLEPKSSYSSAPSRRCLPSSDRNDDTHAQPLTLDESSHRRDCSALGMDTDTTCLPHTRPTTNQTKPANAHNSSNSSIRKSAKIWYQPHMSRDEAIEYLRTKPPGAFIVRQSHTFSNSYGLAVKVPKNQQNDDDDRNIRHFLIESNSKGVRIRGCTNEPYFGSLTALVHQHTLTRLALPCCIILPGSGLDSDTEEQQVTFEGITNSTNKALDAKATASFAVRTFVALYLGSIDTDSLSGSSAVSKAVEVLLENRAQVKQTEVSIRVSPDGVTLTDVQRKLFFRRHYPLTSISYCGTENTASWDSSETRARGIAKARIFGFVARKTSANENMCHMLCECSSQDSARTITHFLAGCIAIS